MVPVTVVPAMAVAGRETRADMSANKGAIFPVELLLAGFASKVLLALALMLDTAVPTGTATVRVSD